MGGAVQSQQRSEALRNGIATVIVAGLLAVSMACMATLLPMLWSALTGGFGWQRSGLDQHTATSMQWLAGAPVQSSLAAWLDSPKDWLPFNGHTRTLVALGLAFFPLMLIPGLWLGPTLMARYDSQTLQPPSPRDGGVRWAGPTGAGQAAAWQRLHAWCHAGTGTGRSPFWRPWVLPQVTQRFAVAVLTEGSGTDPSQLAEALGRELDGSLALEACTSRLDAIRLRLRVKYHNCQWWRTRQDCDPWDSGSLVQGAVAQDRLAVFAPRRATLIVAVGWTPQSLVWVIETLHARAPAFRHPVRLLIVDAPACRRPGLCGEAERTVWMGAAQQWGAVSIIDMP